MTFQRTIFNLIVLSLILVNGTAAGARSARWTEQQANEWYGKQKWSVGANYIPANAINQLEMWQAETFDPACIDRELGWAESLGMNTMRVFLHDLPWQQDSEGFKKRIDRFLALAEKHQVKPVLVLFDSCWDPRPRTGPQHPPVPGVHNSGWVQSPGVAALQDAGQYERLKKYVRGVVGAFANDSRILAWDVWNEPDNLNGSSYGKTEPANKNELVAGLLPQVFSWARSVDPVQPLTSGVWQFKDWTAGKVTPVERTQLEESDIISFHNYGWPEDFEQCIRVLQTRHRPLICTEYMARGVGSTFDTVLPIAKKQHVGAINWGFVAGKTQTYLPWDSWQKPYVVESPPVWFHDVLREDGKPYRAREAEILRSLTSEK
jgi:hypothetical protein